MKLKFVWHHIQINKHDDEKMTAKYFTIPYSSLEDWPTFLIYSRISHINRLIISYGDSTFTEKRL